jgi:hypothetical protein
LKGLLQQIESRHESLISRQARKEMPPIIVNQLVHRFLLKQTLQMTEQVNGHEFLVGKHGLCIIAQALKTDIRTGIVNVADKHI